MRKLLPLAILLSGCAGKRDGTWLIFATLEEDSTDANNPSIGVEYRLMADIYRTDETFFMDFSGSLLTGTADKEGFETRMSSGMQVTGTDCELASESQEMVAKGTWGDDLGFDGDLVLTESYKVVGCDAAGDDADETATLRYSMTGMKMDPNDGTEGGHFGYAPVSPWSGGGGGY